MKKRYLVAVSGGPDSMALLEMLRQKQLDLLVAHVNYHKRLSADRDEKIVSEYCKQYNIPFFVLAPEHEQGNFQHWARQVRLAFFKQLVLQYQLSGVYLAHHADDVLETYLLQKKQRRLPQYWGIKAQITINGLLLKRPLLDYFKTDLIAYCQKHQLAYGEDESNYTDQYTRNQLRHQLLSHYSKKQKLALLAEIKQANQILAKNQQVVAQAVAQLLPEFTQQAYIKLTPPIFRLAVLRSWLIKQGVNAYHFSTKQVLKLEEFILASGNGEYLISADLNLVRDYQTIKLQSAQQINYQYELLKIDALITPYFKVTQTGPLNCGVTVKATDFPLTIRNFKPADRIKLTYGHKKVSRYFIDEKIPRQKRQSWPIVLNCQQEIILVPGLGANITHFSNNPNLFVLK